MIQNYEKLGAFYLGKEYDPTTRSLKDDLILYDSKDLNTHAVIIGMTGSGKTGLGIALLEEALIDNIPIIAIDPYGAGMHQTVIVSSDGSAAREAVGDPSSPVRQIIVAIVDEATEEMVA